MVNEIMDAIAGYDSEVGAAIKAECARQRRNIELIASENIVSEGVMMAMGTVLTNKYAEGYPGKRYYGGCEKVDVVEDIARERAKKLFNSDYANVQPHSGAQANLAVFFAVLEPGDTVMGMNLDQGGHLSHGSPVNISGKYFNIVSYGVDENGYIDYDALREKALECKPKMIIAGASAYARTIDFKKFREVCDEVGAVLMADIAHIAGLVAAGVHPSPFPYADVVTTTTHKTLRGPRGGLILANKEAAEKFYATRDSIKDATYTTALRNSRPLNHATDYLRNVNAEIDNLAADSAAYRKYLDTTTWHKRIQNNTQKFKNDVNTTLMKFYEKRLKTLKSKQENQK